MATHHDYVLHVTAGSKYDEHTPVGVNTEKAIKISTDEADIELLVRIQNYRASESNASEAGAEANSKYFDHPSRHGALYSLQFALTPKKELSSDDIVLGNDFDKPIKQYLPPFFGTGLNIVKTVIDPGLDGDPYGEKPYLYGPLVSSINVMRIGGKDAAGGDKEAVLEEGADGEDAEKIRSEVEMPAKGSARQSFFLQKPHRERFVFEAGRRYSFDFFNAYLDFNEFALKLPMGIKFNVLHQLSDEEIPPLRYVLKDTKTDTLLFQVTFTLERKEDEGDDEDEDEEDEEDEEEAPNDDVD